MRYHNLDIWLQGDGPPYTIRGSCPEPHGGEIPDEASAVDLAEIERIQVRILRNKDVDEPFLTAAGRKLFGFLFGAGRLHDQFHACLGAATDKEQGVRIRLRIASPEMAAVPWEYASDYRGFLSTRPETAIVRYHEVQRPIEKLDTQLPAKVLVVVPEGSRLDVPVELKALEAALDGMAHLEILQGLVTLDRLVEQLHGGNEYHVLHFIGHGAVHDGRAYLILNSEDGGEDEVDHDTLGNALEAHDSLKLVVLNCCEGAAVAPEDGEDPRVRDGARAFIGLAPELVRCGVPAVLAMQYEITDDEAIFFAKIFYGNLFSRQEGGRIEVAAARARHALGARREKGRTLGAPVLYLHAEEGVLFDLRHQLKVPKLLRAPKLLELLDQLLALPFTRRAADTIHAVARTRERNLALRQAGASGEDTEIAQRMEHDLASLKSLRRRLQVVVAATVGLALVLLSSVGLDSQLPAWMRPEYHAVALGNSVAGPPFSDALALVVIDEPSLRELSPDSQKVDSTWRRYHAVLVRKLATAGARVVAFDVYFESPSEYDAEFASAIGDAAESTRVVVGVRADHQVPGPEGTVERQPRLAPAIAASGAAWGAVCAGISRSSPNTVPLFFEDVGRASRVQSLVLSSVGAFTRTSQAAFDPGGSKVHLMRPNGPIVQSIPVLPPAFAVPGQECSIIGPDDELYEMIVNFMSLDVLRDPVHRASYAEVLRASPVELGRFRDKLVLVGSETDIELPGWSDRRLGFELVADAMNTILTGAVLRWLDPTEHAVAILMMAVLGALLAANQRSPRWARVALLLFASALYVVAAAYAYAEHGLLLNAVYHLLALWIGYAGTRLVTHRWWRRDRKTREGRPDVGAGTAARSAAAILLCLVAMGCTPRAYGRLQTVAVDDSLRVQPNAEGVTRRVYIERGDRTIEAGHNARLRKGDRVRVDPGLTATFTVQDEYQVTLTDSAEIEILNPKIRLDRGRMRARRVATGRPPRRRLRTETRYVVTGVAGTEFEIGVEPDDTVAIGVEHGLVAVAPKDRVVTCDQVLLLRAGESITFHREQIVGGNFGSVPGAISEPEREEWVRSIVGDEPIPLWDLEEGWCLECLVLAVVFQEIVEGSFREGHSRVPRVTGLPLDSARVLLARQELEVGVVCSQVTGEKAANTVLAQFPDSLYWLPEGEAVNLIVEGLSISVPDLVGVQRDTALARLRSAGLETGPIIVDSTSPLLPGMVTGQEPAARTLVRAGMAVALRVAARVPAPVALLPPVRVHFAFDVDTLTQEALLALDPVGAALARDSSLSVEVDGHSDRVGSEAYNLDLSRRRAGAVAEYLINWFGILPARIRACGFGESRPERESGRAQNRRAVVRPVPRSQVAEVVPC